MLCEISMKFVDLAAEYQFFKTEITSRLNTVYSSGQYLFGPQLLELEKRMASYVGIKEAVGVKNCTDAIMMILRKEVIENKRTTIILPNFGAYPTSIACRHITKKLYYVDVDESMTIDVNKLPSNIKNGIIIAVHLFGNNCNMPVLLDYAKQNNHIIIEDCAQATGSGCGKHGKYSVFSFYPTKPLSAMGDGGLICSNVSLDWFKQLRFYGQQDNKVLFPGVNSRMDETQCAVVNAKLDSLIDLNSKRQAIAERYKKIIKSYKVIDNSVYHQFTVLFNNRDLVIEDAKLNDIPYMIHYPWHVTDFECLQGPYNNAVGFRVSDKIMSFPCHPYMSEDDIQRVKNFLYIHQGFEVI